MTRKITIALIHVVTLGLVAYDIWVAIEPSPRDTLSKVGLDEMTRHPSIAVLVGILIGHIAWPMITYGEGGAWKWTIPFLTAAWLVFVVCDFVGGVLPRTAPISYLAVGVVLGHFLWAQKLV